MSAVPYVPRRVLVDDELVLDDHQQVLVAVEQLATQWTAEATELSERGGDLRIVAAGRAHAEQLRILARLHARRSPR